MLFLQTFHVISFGQSETSIYENCVILILIQLLIISRHCKEFVNLRPMKEMVMCMENVPEACSFAETQIKNATDGVSEMMSQFGMAFPEYEKAKMFIKNHCLALPAGIVLILNVSTTCTIDNLFCFLFNEKNI